MDFDCETAPLAGITGRAPWSPEVFVEVHLRMVARAEMKKSGAAAGAR